jgi:hypothetical protein
LCRQQNLRLFGESSASPTIKKTTIFVQIIIIVGVADNGGSGSKLIVASITLCDLMNFTARFALDKKA